MECSALAPPVNCLVAPKRCRAPQPQPPAPRKAPAEAAGPKWRGGVVERECDLLPTFLGADSTHHHNGEKPAAVQAPRRGRIRQACTREKPWFPKEPFLRRRLFGEPTTPARRPAEQLIANSVGAAPAIGKRAGPSRTGTSTPLRHWSCTQNAKSERARRFLLVSRRRDV